MPDELKPCGELEDAQIREDKLKEEIASHIRENASIRIENSLLRERLKEAEERMRWTSGETPPDENEVIFLTYHIEEGPDCDPLVRRTAHYCVSALVDGEFRPVLMTRKEVIKPAYYRPLRAPRRQKMPDELKLRECPFCGSANIELDAYAESYPVARCTCCDAKIEVRYGKKIAAEAWNARPLEDALRVENARMKEQIAQAQKGPITLSEVLICEAHEKEIEGLRAENKELTARRKKEAGEYAEVCHNLSAVCGTLGAEIEVLRAKLQAAEELLSEIYDNTGGKLESACPVCMTCTHKAWCWYPRILRMLGKSLDDFDKKHLALTENGNERTR